MRASVQTRPGAEVELHLLTDWQEPERTSRWLRAGTLSLLVHALLFPGIVILAQYGGRTDSTAPSLPVNLRRSTPLIAPRLELTQKEPNRGKLSKEVNLESLLPHPPVKTPPPAPKTMPRPLRLPEPSLQARTTPKLTPGVPEPPKLDVPAGKAPPTLGMTAQAPPVVAPPAVEPPKILLETSGNAAGIPDGKGTGAPKIPPAPKGTVAEAIEKLSRSGHSGGVIVGDEEGGPIRAPASAGKVQSNLELLSDPMGVDFRPYLIKVLAAVRRNWFAVIPESARMGRRGKVLIQFAISRDGHVPKLVIAMPSGAEALDRAAVAGISASNPFPPLPPEFRGDQVRLQLSFLYNMTN
jgi:TonB family protein